MKWSHAVVQLWVVLWDVKDLMRVKSQCERSNTANNESEKEK